MQELLVEWVTVLYLRHLFFEGKPGLYAFLDVCCEIWAWLQIGLIFTLG
jgi:hypothetical protein